MQDLGYLSVPNDLRQSGGPKERILLNPRPAVCSAFLKLRETKAATLRSHSPDIAETGIVTVKFDNVPFPACPGSKEPLPDKWVLLVCGSLKLRNPLFLRSHQFGHRHLTSLSNSTTIRIYSYGCGCMRRVPAPMEISS